MIVDIHPFMHHAAILLKASPKGEGLYPSPKETLRPLRPLDFFDVLAILPNDE
jgi:hypothetical protein